MRRRLSYKTEEDAERIEAEQAIDGFALIEVQNHFDGNFLVFSDGKPEIPLEEQIWKLEKRVSALENTHAGVTSDERSNQ